MNRPPTPSQLSCGVLAVVHAGGTIDGQAGGRLGETGKRISVAPGNFRSAWEKPARRERVKLNRFGPSQACINQSKRLTFRLPKAASAADPNSPPTPAVAGRDLDPAPAAIWRVVVGRPIPIGSAPPSPTSTCQPPPCQPPPCPPPWPASRCIARNRHQADDGDRSKGNESSTQHNRVLASLREVSSRFRRPPALRPIGQ